MNKNLKRLIKGLFISIATLLAGYFITMVSFNLFDFLSVNQMRILFAVDFICLICAGSIVLIVDDKKRQKQMKRKHYVKVRNEKISQREKQFKEIMAQVNFSNNVA